MWLVKEVEKEGGLLARTEQARDFAVEFYKNQGLVFEIIETFTHELPDPMET